MSASWSEVKLGSVLKQSEEQIELDPTAQYQQVTIPLWGKGVVQRDIVYGSEIGANRRYVVRTGQFILSRIDARHGAFGLVPANLDGAVVSNDFPSFNIDHTCLIPKFLGWLSRTNDFVEICLKASEGTTNRVRLKLDRFLGTPVFLPPLDEQRRIVVHIEELAARIEEARGLRQQAVEEAEALLSAETRRLLENSGSGNWHTVGDCCEVRGGIQKSSIRTPLNSPRRYLTVAHVQRNWIDLTDPRYFEVSDEELERWRLLPGDVLVVEGNGSADQIGRTALFRGEIEACVHQNHIIRVRPNQQYLLPEFLNIYLNSPVGQDEMKGRSRTSSGLYHLSVDRIRSIQIPLLTLGKQRHIVSHLENFQTNIAELVRLQTETTAELDALLPSILDKAFKGEL